MSDYIVTVKLPRNPEHNPNNKKEGKCPVDNKSHCTDVTGAHHSFLRTNALSANLVRLDMEALGFHVTRIEAVSE